MSVADFSDTELAAELTKRGWFCRVKAGRAEQDRIARERRAMLADLVADGMSISAAGRHMGVSPQRASQMWQRLLADMEAEA